MELRIAGETEAKTMKKGRILISVNTRPNLKMMVRRRMTKTKQMTSVPEHQKDHVFLKA